MPADITQITWASFNVSPMLGPGGICQTYFPYQILQDPYCSLNLHDNLQTAGSALRSITMYQNAHASALHRSRGKVCQLVQTPRASLRSVPTCKDHRANKDRAQETHCINNASALLGKHRPTRPLFFAFFSQRDKFTLDEADSGLRHRELTQAAASSPVSQGMLLLFCFAVQLPKCKRKHVLWMRNAFLTQTRKDYFIF